MIVACSCVGTKGKFGNAMHQYAITRSYADAMQCIYCSLAEWIGRTIFEINDDPVPMLPLIREEDFHFGNVNINLYGFFQSRRFYEWLSVERCRKYFRIQDRWLKRFPKREEPYVAFHIRRGDMADFHWSYPTFTEESYERAWEK